MAAILPRSPRAALICALVIAAALAAPATAVHASPRYVPGELLVKREGTQAARVVRLAPGASVTGAVARWRKRPGVADAAPNYVAHAAGFIPDDTGRDGPGGWLTLQWNFLPEAGVGAPNAWANLQADGRPGGRGVTIAVLDTGVAYRNSGRHRRSPDFSYKQFVPGYDFVAGDRYPDDENGHGTFVAGIIAERTNNRFGLTGLAYGARIMPVRVLDSQGLGDAAAIAAGVRFATRRGADIINLSLEFDASLRRSEIFDLLAALRYAHGKGVLIVGASGNEADNVIAYPARAADVISVGATTEHRCLAEYSNEGRGLDIVAPGGGDDAALPDPGCKPLGPAGRDLFQMTYLGVGRRFGFPDGYEGTSMAAPHVAAVAALVIASGVLGPHPTPKAVERRLEATAQDLGAPGYDLRYGHGLLNADAATARLPGP